MSRSIKLAAAALVALGAASQASAASFTISQQNAGDVFADAAGMNSFKETVTTNFGTFNAGQFRLSGDNGLGDFEAFCIDLRATLNLPDTYVSTPNFLSAAVTTNLDILLSNVGAINSNEIATGVQLAIWEIVEDTDAMAYDLTMDDFSVSAASTDALANANLYLSNIENNVWTTGGSTFAFLDSTGGQDVIALGVAPVPLPAPALLLGAGLVALAGMRRRA